MSEIATTIATRLSVLDQTHRRLGAKMGERDGWLVPLTYVDQSEEYRAVRTRGAGLADLSSRSRILVSGAESVQFLNGLITNDVKTLESGMWMPAAFPNVQGRLLAFVRVLHLAGGFLFDTEPSSRDAVMNTLERFTLAGDFRVTEVTDEISTITVQGSRSGEILAQVLGIDEVSCGRVVELEWNEHKIDVIRATHTAEDGFDLFVPAAGAAALWDAFQIAGAEPVGFDAMEVMRIEAGLPRFGVDVDPTNVVLEAGLDETVSFTKGCYIGQEIIARIHWRGHVAKRLAGVVMNDAETINPDDKVFSNDGKEIGRITSSCHSPTLALTVALAMIKYNYLTEGTIVTITSLDVKRGGRIVDLPLVKGSWYTKLDDSIAAK